MDLAIVKYVIEHDAEVVYCLRGEMQKGMWHASRGYNVLILIFESQWALEV